MLLRLPDAALEAVADALDVDDLARLAAVCVAARGLCAPRVRAWRELARQEVRDVVHFVAWRPCNRIYMRDCVHMDSDARLPSRALPGAAWLVGCPSSNSQMFDRNNLFKSMATVVLAPAVLPPEPRQWWLERHPECWWACGQLCLGPPRFKHEVRTDEPYGVRMEEGVVRGVRPAPKCMNFVFWLLEDPASRL